MFILKINKIKYNIFMLTKIFKKLQNMLIKLFNNKRIEKELLIYIN